MHFMTQLCLEQAGPWLRRPQTIAKLHQLIAAGVLANEAVEANARKAHKLLCGTGICVSPEATLAHAWGNLLHLHRLMNTC